MDISRLIQHPEEMDKETLYDLRELVALYPYYQTARILLLQNLYLLHDATFNEELKRAAIYLADRRVIFQMVEAAHYQLKVENSQQHIPSDAGKAPTGDADRHDSAFGHSTTDRTTDLIDSFLGSIPTTEEEKEESKNTEKQGKRRRKPTAADAAIDYMTYLMETEEQEGVSGEEESTSRTISLIDNFIDDGGFKLQPVDTSQPFEPEYTPDLPSDGDEKDAAEKAEGGVFTETLARIYIKQKRYDRALAIMRQLEKAGKAQKKHNAYLADQMRFLEKLIKNGTVGEQTSALMEG